MKKHLLTLVLICCSNNLYSMEWSGNLSVQSRLFFDEPLAVNSQQHDQYLSVAARPELYHSWDDDTQSITFTPFVRLDQHDKERSHTDIHELAWQRVFDHWELKIGISKVYWGVTESQHLVDVINQTDLVENTDGEDKLGQPMIRASTEQDWGLLDVYLLPFFRERSFAGIEGRPRAYPVVDTDLVQYESSDEERHIDYALRWLQAFDELELALSYFNGTSREPLLTPTIYNGSTVLLPYYPLMTQYGLAAQATLGNWLWKLETIHRQWLNENYNATTTGFEYTLVGLMESSADLGIITEYLYDNREQQASSFLENDIMVGLRLALNDAQSTEALLGFIVDLDTDETIISLEASRRLGDNWKLELELRSFHHLDNNSLLSSLKQDDMLQIDLACYF
ncbi:MAG: hypothetical protein OEY43_09355 [Gammaproteobacteria bacterium]|nr:hypothetical protein [Gammaproteobacteria bacterium]